MHRNAVLLIYLWLCSLLSLAATATQDLEKREPPATCTTSTPAPKGLHCGETGLIKSPHILTRFGSASEESCISRCRDVLTCASSSYLASTKACTLYADHISDRNFVRKSNGVVFRDRGCFHVTCKCPKPYILCGGICVNPSSDSNNCGVCGHHCPAGSSCVKGHCVCRLHSHNPCGRGCVDFSTDSNNCGFCFNVCPSGTSCVGGFCTCQDSSLTFCNGNCVNIHTSNQNCGGCGNACPSDQNCVNGSCVCSSSESLCGTQCVNITTDSQNCGACGFTCPEGQGCSDGSCTCPPLYTNCCPNCYNLANDSNHCGECGNQCPPDQYCNNGACACSDSAQTLCNGFCRNLVSDNDNCGYCGFGCVDGSVCQNGACACDSAGAGTPQAYCYPGICANILYDSNHCGSCSMQCDSAQLCINGGCQERTCESEDTWNCDLFNAGLVGCSTPDTSCLCIDYEGTGPGYCGDGSTLCPTLDTCNTSIDCPSDHYCAFNTCCPDKVCVPMSFPQCPTNFGAALFKRGGMPAMKGIL